MKIIRSEKEMISHCNELKSRTSFIPTMGSLHDGHIKLLVEGKKYSNYLISSLFISKSTLSKLLYYFCYYE